MVKTPRNLTPTVKRKILNAIRKGHYQKDTAFLAGVAESTLKSWLAAGKADETESSELYKFWLKYQKALIEAESVLLKGIRRGDQTTKVIKNNQGQVVQRELIRKQKTGDLRWLLAKRNPERYGDGLAGMLQAFEDRYGEEFSEMLADLIEAAEAERDASIEYDEPELSDGENE